jgi:predicted glycogen debranching enzyme
VIHPQGYRYLTQFTAEPMPMWTYEVEGRKVRKTVFMVHGENTTVVEYELLSGEACQLQLRPLIAFRDYHSLTHRNGVLRGAVEERPGCVTVQPYEGLPALHFLHSGGDIVAAGDWYMNFEYDRERDRGLDYQEDLYCPFAMTFDLNSNIRVVMRAGDSAASPHADSELKRLELERRRQIVDSAPCTHPVVRRLTAAADQYIVKRGDLETIIAGYHWFSDWGRDTMIALPGLTLVTGRFETAKKILRAFAEAMDAGMLPNRFPDVGNAPEYNTVDATLWFFEAVRAYLAHTGDEDFVHRTLCPKLRESIDWHLRGTRYGIKADSDGLLNAGVPGSQLTWMDSKIGDWVVTPRHGKAVEIQALWYNALRVMQSLTGDTLYKALADRARNSFQELFWNGETGCLYDVAGDASIRPNQIFAVGLHHAILDEPDRARSVVEVVERELLTPFGLRSLSPRDPAYRGRYAGGVFERDSAYHQGTVWPWLIGPFVNAYMRVYGRPPEHALDGLIRGLDQLCIGHIAEVADAEPPYAPGGCVAQAWSVAELLRAAILVLVPKQNTVATA